MTRAAPRAAYLPHVDGLRTVALVLVLCFHFGLASFRGGYLGVDVFFVLSGYLITRNLLHAPYTLRSFYAHRFHRLYPASLLTTLLTLAAAHLFFPPSLALRSARSALASLVSLSNLHFHFATSYFAPDARLEPLLHTWSLSLEEQFYLVHPALLRLPFRAPLLTALAALSLVASLLTAPRHPAAAFYHLPHRAYQPLLGALLAIRQQSSDATKTQSPPPTSTTPAVPPPLSPVSILPLSSVKPPEAAPPWHEAVAALALTAVLGCAGTLPASAPPLHTLPVTLATALLLALPNTAVGRMLSHPALTVLAPYSYAAYLLHWPLYVFVAHVSRGLRVDIPPPMALMAATLLLSRPLKSCFEDPVRRGGVRARRAFYVLIPATFAFALFSFFTNGYEGRFGGLPPVFKTKSARNVRTLCYEPAGNRSTSANASPTGCRLGDANGLRSKYAVFGDSFALQLAPGLHEAALQRGMYVELHYRTGCRFRPQAQRRLTNNNKLPCRDTHDRLWYELSRLPKGTVVVVANSWWWTKPSAMRQTLTDLRNDIKQVGYEMMIAGEPPGVSEEESWYFACADLAMMPMVRLWHWVVGREYRGAAGCLDKTRELRPWRGRLWQWRAYSRVFGSELRDVGFLDQFGFLCPSVASIASVGDDVRCTLPANSTGFVYEIGYNRDMRHLSFEGSMFLTRLYERELFGAGEVAHDAGGQT